MNFRYSKRRSLLSSNYNPRGLFRNSSRYWDFALQPFWDEMNVGTAQEVAQSFVNSRGTSNPFRSCNSTLSETTTQRLPLAAPSSSPSSSTMNVHWVETPTSHIFRADVPGLRKEDLSILVEGSTLQISGQRNLDNIPTDVNERIQWEAPFVRRFRLPTTAAMEQISAMLDHGVLTLKIPKLQIPPSIAWFVPINNCPSQVAIRNWTQGEQSQPDFQGSDQGLVSRMVSGFRSGIQESSCPESLQLRIQSCNLPTNLSSQSVSLKGRDDSLNPNSSITMPADPNMASKTLNITQEEGTGPNAQVTLNININTRKDPIEGESSPIQVSPTNKMEDQKLLLDERASISPLPTLKPRSSFAQMEGNEDEEINPHPSISRRKSSIQIGNNQDVDSSPPPTPKHQSVLQAEDADFPPRPSTLRHKSSIQRNGEGDEDLDLSSFPVLAKRDSKVENINTLQRLSLGRRKTERQPSMLGNYDGEASTSNVEGLAINERRRSTKRDSQAVERQPSMIPDQERGLTSNIEDFAINERQKPLKRDSQVIERHPSMAENDGEESTYSMESLATNERQRSRKRRSNSKERRKSEKETSPKRRSDSQERRESENETTPSSTRRKSSLGKRGSITEGENELGRRSSVEGGRRESTKRLSRRRESSRADVTTSDSFDAPELDLEGEEI